MNQHTVFPLKPYPGMPPRAPLEMPVQNLAEPPRARPDTRPATPVFIARCIAFGGAAALAFYGAYEMTGVVSVGGVTVLEAVMTAVFAATFAWIAFAASSALAGVLAPPARHVRLARPGGCLSTLTALVMPIHHEDPVRTTAALEAMAKALHGIGEAAAFEIVVLSDSGNAESWISETLCLDRLKARLHDVMPVWYRRRWLNDAKKAGNVKDFVEQWGGRYDHFIILDADSLMAAETLVTLAAAMEADRRLGILQTVPALICGQTLFARLQQFAGRVHGPIVARGLAAWQGSDGNYWGHNAIIRTAAFAACCGLPHLSGKKPFGGPILSHDFVEAALLRRAGWGVEIATRLGGSWEESPPSLIDAATRDRRWAQGNLQHAKVISARGLSAASRAHLAIGILSYLASPLWLLLIAFGFALSVQAQLIRPEYFSDGLQLFPTWPHFDSERMVRLFALTMLVLLLPKLMGLTRALASPELRRGCGGALGLIGSFFTELAVSALFAPIMMVIHSRQIYEILAGRDSGWSAQRRDAQSRWRDVWVRHRWHTACGLAMGAATWLLSPAILAWLAPTVAGLLLAVPLSRASGSLRVGGRLRRARLLLTPEETAPHPLFQARDEAARDALAMWDDPLVALVTDPTVRARHFSWATSRPRLRGAPDPAYLTAVEKVAEARSLDEALALLEPRERLHVAGSQAIAEQVARLPRGEAAGPEDGQLFLSGMLDPPPERAQMRSPAA